MGIWGSPGLSLRVEAVLRGTREASRVGLMNENGENIGENWDRDQQKIDSIDESDHSGWPFNILY